LFAAAAFKQVGVVFGEGEPVVVDCCCWLEKWVFTKKLKLN